jgi:hypothetical protein
LIICFCFYNHYFSSVLPTRVSRFRIKNLFASKWKVFVKFRFVFACSSENKRTKFLFRLALFRFPNDFFASLSIKNENFHFKFSFVLSSVYNYVLRSRSRKESNNFGKIGGGAVTRCGYGSDVYGPDDIRLRRLWL